METDKMIKGTSYGIVNEKKMNSANLLTYFFLRLLIFTFNQWPINTKENC